MSLHSRSVPSNRPATFAPAVHGRARGWRVAAAVLFAAACAGCVPLVVGGAVGGAAVVADRRPVGIQIEDEAIEHRVNRAVAERFRIEPINVDVTAYNRRVLLTGEAPNETIKAEIEKIASATQNVKDVVNDIGIGQVSSVGSRTNDTVVGSKVRAALLDVQGLPAGVVRVSVERARVYLMGRVTGAEADAAARAVARVSGVEQVIKVFELVSEDEARALGGNPPASGSDAPRR